VRPVWGRTVGEIVRAALSAYCDLYGGDGRVLSPREVYNELTRKDDHVAAWAKERMAGFVEPTEEVMRASGAIFEHELPASGDRDGADPWVIAEAQVRCAAM